MGMESMSRPWKRKNPLRRMLPQIWMRQPKPSLARMNLVGKRFRLGKGPIQLGSSRVSQTLRKRSRICLTESLRKTKIRRRRRRKPNRKQRGQNMKPQKHRPKARLSRQGLAAASRRLPSLRCGDKSRGLDGKRRLVSLPMGIRPTEDIRPLPILATRASRPIRTLTMAPIRRLSSLGTTRLGIRIIPPITASRPSP